MRKLNVDLVVFEEFDNDVVSYDFYFYKYISEMCLNIEFCDFILYIFVVYVVLDSFEFLVFFKKLFFVLKFVQILVILSQEKINFLILIFSFFFLLYVIINSVRVFILKIFFVNQKGYDFVLIILLEIVVNL